MLPPTPLPPPENKLPLAQAIAAELDYLTAADSNLLGAMAISPCQSRVQCYRTIKLAIAAYVHVLNRQLGKTNDPLPQANLFPTTKEQGPEA